VFSQPRHHRRMPAVGRVGGAAPPAPRRHGHACTSDGDALVLASADLTRTVARSADFGVFRRAFGTSTGAARNLTP
jgi:hypothetical protein